MDEVSDNDAEMKGKAKLYADQTRRAAESQLQPGDSVLLKQKRENKLTTTFAPVPHKVISKYGNSVTVESPQGVQYTRNSTHVKKFPSPEESSISQNGDGEERGEISAEGGEEASSKQGLPRRSLRNRAPPTRFKDYDLSRLRMLVEEV